MKEYTVIGRFKYREKEFELLIDDNLKYFFLEITADGEKNYVQLQDYIALAKFFSHNKKVLNIKGKEKVKPAVIYKGKIVALTVAIISLLSGCSFGQSYDQYFDFNPFEPYSYSDTMSADDNYDNYDNYSEEYYNADLTEQAIKDMLSDIAEEEKNFHLETKDDLWDLTMVYDASVLDEVLGYSKSSVTYDTIRETINNNQNIPKKFKELYILLANNLQKQYPNMDLRIWYENLKTMKILEVDEMDMYLKAFSTDAYACYRIDENTIYTVKGYDYIPGTWEYQVIMHEMGHPIRSTNLVRESQEIRAQFESQSGFGSIVAEALNSLFTLRSYDKKEKDIAYQLQSNMVEIMVDCMPNYTLQDFVEHNVSYFIAKLNETNHNTDAIRMLALIDLQYKDYHSEEIQVDQEEFYPLYDYLAKMYYDFNIKPGMTREQAEEVYKEFADRLTYDVPAEYKIDKKHLKEFFETYCQSISLRAMRTSSHHSTDSIIIYEDTSDQIETRSEEIAHARQL